MKLKVFAIALLVLFTSLIYVNETHAANGDFLFLEDIPKSHYVVFVGDEKGMMVYTSPYKIFTKELIGENNLTGVWGTNITVWNYWKEKGKFEWFTGPYTVSEENYSVLKTSNVGNKVLFNTYPPQNRDGGIYEGGTGGTEGGVNPTKPIKGLETVEQIPMEMGKTAKILVTVGLVVLAILLGVSLIKRVIYSFL